jgi:chaperone BCS1
MRSVIVYGHSLSDYSFLPLQDELNGGFQKFHVSMQRNGKNTSSRLFFNLLLNSAQRLFFTFFRDNTQMFNTTWTFLQGTLDGFNGFVTVGFGLLLLNTYVLPYIFSWSRQIFNFVRQHLYVQIEVLENDNYFDWLMKWLTDHRQFFLITANYRAKLTKIDLESELYSFRRKLASTSVSTRNPPQLAFEPGPGQHLLWYRRHLVWLDLIAGDEKSLLFHDYQRSRMAKLVLWKLGPSKEVIGEMLLEARDYCLAKEKEHVVIYTYEDSLGLHGKWHLFMCQEKLPFHSVILPGNLAQKILNDTKFFLQQKEKYKSKGVPYRQTYLFYGPPGGGKTSFVKALAGELNLSICIISLNSLRVDDSHLTVAFAEAPENSIILLEDIDAAFSSHADEDDDIARKRDDFRRLPFSKGVTFSGILNAIDGVASQEGRIIIMTTNHPERLDPALLRPGRSHHKYEFILATKEQARRFFLHFHPRETERAHKFANDFEENRYSMAQLQAHFVATMDDPQLAADYSYFVKTTEEEEICHHKEKRQSPHTPPSSLLCLPPNKATMNNNNNCNNGVTNSSTAASNNNDEVDSHNVSNPIVRQQVETMNPSDTANNCQT